MDKIKAVLITGASRGIGAEIARKSLIFSITGEQSPLVIVTARSEDSLRLLEQESTSMNGNVVAIPADITQASDRKALVSQVSNLLKTRNAVLHGIVHNAGVLRAKSFVDLSEEDWNLHYQTHLLGPAMLTRLLVPLFSHDGGHIVHISSMGGFQGSKKFPGLSAYSSMKGAFSVLAESLAVELMDRGIACNALCLGAVQTEMLEEAFPGFKAPVTPSEMGEWIAHFLWKGHHLFNGKILPVSLQDPS